VLDKKRHRAHTTTTPHTLRLSDLLTENTRNNTHTINNDSTKTTVVSTVRLSDLLANTTANS